MRSLVSHASKGVDRANRIGDEAYLEYLEEYLLGGEKNSRIIPVAARCKWGQCRDFKAPQNHQAQGQPVQLRDPASKADGTNAQGVSKQKKIRR